MQERNPGWACAFVCIWVAFKVRGIHKNYENCQGGGIDGKGNRSGLDHWASQDEGF